MPSPDYIVDIEALKQPQPERTADAAKGVARPWLAVHWKCCHTYSRIYRNRSGAAYEGRCPKCARLVRATIGEGGTSARFFEAN